MAFTFLKNLFSKAEVNDAADAWVYSGTWLTVASSNVQAIRYLHDDLILEVEFMTGRYYQYFDVPAELAKRFYFSDSPGRFEWNELRNVYSFVRLTSLGGVSGGRRNVIRTRNDVNVDQILESGEIPDYLR